MFGQTTVDGTVYEHHAPDEDYDCRYCGLPWRVHPAGILLTWETTQKPVLIQYERRDAWGHAPVSRNRVRQRWGRL